MHDRLSDAKPAAGTEGSAHAVSGSSHCALKPCAQHSSHAHDIAGGHRELEVLIDASQPTIYCLPDATDRLAPTEVLLDALTDDLAYRVAGMAGGACVKGAAAAASVVARHVRRHLARPAIGNEVGGVVGLVGTQRSEPCACRGSSIARAAARSPVPSAGVTTALTTSPKRFSISTCPW